MVSGVKLAIADGSLIAFLQPKATKKQAKT